MKEKEVKVKAIEELERGGWVSWWPYKKAFFRKQEQRWEVYGNDIFNVFDFVACRKKSTILVQITTSPNLAARRKKIQAWLETVPCDPVCYVWAWHKKKNRFVKQKICRVNA